MSTKTRISTIMRLVHALHFKQKMGVCRLYLSLSSSFVAIHSSPTLQRGARLSNNLPFPTMAARAACARFAGQSSR